MMKLNTTAKILLFVTVSFFVVWLGGYIARQLAIYQLFDPVETTLRQLYGNHLTAVFYTLLPLIALNLITFAFFLISFIMFLLFSHINLKKNGWLFIITLIIVVTTPFEIYLSIMDYKIVNLILSDQNSVNQILELIKQRMIKLSSFSLIEVFSYLAIIFLALFQPLKKNEN